MDAPREGIASLAFDGGLVLYDSAGDLLLAYNESAGLVWQAVENGTGANGAADTLADAYGIPRGQALTDSEGIIAHWRAYGLLDGAGGSHAPADTEELTFSFDPGPERRNAYRIGGIRLDTIVSGHNIARHLEALMAPFVVEGGANQKNETVYEMTILPCGGEEWSFRVGRVERLRSKLPWEILGAAQQSMMEIAYGNPPWLAIFHSAAVIKNGNAFLLAGRSGSGKSTLTAYLSETGFSYAGDDLAALIAPDGLLAPWPLPQSLKPNSWKPLADTIPELAGIPTTNVAKGDIKYRAAPDKAWLQKPCPVRAIFFPTYDAAADAEITPVAPLGALQLLLEDRVWLGYPLEETKVKQFLDWLEAVPCFAVRYNDLAAARALILNHVG